MSKSNYIGRFAPSPTGLLHIGSLLTAIASYLDARANQGQWLVRMEDLDPPREVEGVASHILKTLEIFGLEWDNEVIYQSKRNGYYQEALHFLQQQQLVYPCFCSRKQWQQMAKQGLDGLVYAGTCAKKTISHIPNTQQVAWRLRVTDETIGFQDKIVNWYQQNLTHDIGDFVLKRADGYWAYQLAVVVDDALQGITHIVRGQDLLVSTPRQIYLQRCLKVPNIHYAHLPLLTNAQGQKWSKQTLAPALNLTQQEQLIRQVLQYLNIPSAPEVSKPKELLDFALLHWQLNKIPKQAICTETVQAA